MRCKIAIKLRDVERVWRDGWWSPFKDEFRTICDDSYIGNTYIY